MSLSLICHSHATPNVQTAAGQATTTAAAEAKTAAAAAAAAPQASSPGESYEDDIEDDEGLGAAADNADEEEDFYVPSMVRKTGKEKSHMCRCLSTLLHTWGVMEYTLSPQSMGCGALGCWAGPKAQGRHLLVNSLGCGVWGFSVYGLGVQGAGFRKRD